MRIDNTVINEIRNKIDIVDIVSNYLPLTTRGKNYFGVCPFHDDHSPSMSVSKERQIYTCFTCGATGNVFKFIQDYEHISFVEAVKKCADICGVELNIKLDNNDISNKKNKELYEIYELSQKFYQNNINSSYGKKAKEYLYNRKLTDEDIKYFEIGLSLDNYDMLTKLLQQKKYSDKDLLKSGISTSNENGIYDIYRNRIMFPLHDPFGNVIGYNGRAYLEGNTNKYVNSKETEIFKKRDFLYNYHRARASARDKDEIIIMEGPMDVIRANTIGIKNVVATLGTAFSSSQSNLIRRLSSNVILCFDGDEAGLKATKGAIEELTKVGITPKIVRLPDNQDPDDYIIKNGKDKFIDRLKNAYDLMEFKEILYKQNIDFKNPNDLSNYIKSMIKEINELDDDILREVTINKLVEDTKVDKEVILSKLNKKEKTEVEITKPKRKKRDKYEKSVENLLYYMLYNVEVIKLYDELITHIPNDRYRSLAFQISAFYKEHGYIEVADLLTEVMNDEDTVKAIGEITSLNLKNSYTVEEIEDYLNNIKEYNENCRLEKYKNELASSDDVEQKIALANKLIEFKLRSEESD